MTSIPGLIIIPDFLTPEEEKSLLQEIDSLSWNTSLKRRTQHYGYEYSYTSKTTGIPAPPFPKSVLEMAKKLDSFFGTSNGTPIIPNQCIINEYLRGQGINPHIDSTSFGPVVVSISLGNETVMEFIKNNREERIVLPPRSLLLMMGEARYEWKHSIPARIGIKYPDNTTIKQPMNYRRVSLTFRTLA